MLRGSLLSFALLFLLSACSDNASVVINEKNLPKEQISCLRLVVFPPDEILQKSFESMYDFDEQCPFVLEVSTKSDIKCNSNYNIQTKATGVFPKSYLRMQLNEGKKILYGYYKDIPESVSIKEVSCAFSRMEEDLSL